MSDTKIEEMKKRIDEMDYDEMLRLWRCAPAGHPYFRRDMMGDYFSKAMEKRKKSISNAEHVEASIAIG